MDDKQLQEFAELGSRIIKKISEYHRNYYGTAKVLIISKYIARNLINYNLNFTHTFSNLRLKTNLADEMILQHIFGIQVIITESNDEIIEVY